MARGNDIGLSPWAYIIYHGHMVHGGIKDDGRLNLALAALTFVLAATLRLIGLRQGLWLDEIMSVREYFHAPWIVLVTRVPTPNHHPLYSLMAKPCILLLGEKEWTVRLPAFVLGSLTPPLLYLRGRTTWNSLRRHANKLRPFNPLKAIKTTCMSSDAHDIMWP